MGEDSKTLGSGYGLSARYTHSALDVVAGFVRQNAGTGGTGAAQGAVLGGSYDFGVARFYLGYTRERNDCTNCGGALSRPAGVASNGHGDFRLINVGTRVPFGAFTAIAQYVRLQDRTEYAVNPGKRDANWWAIGGEYALSKRTLIYTSVGSISNQNGSQYALGTGSAQLPANSVAGGNPHTTTVNLGIRHSF